MRKPRTVTFKIKRHALLKLSEKSQIKKYILCTLWHVKYSLPVYVAQFNVGSETDRHYYNSCSKLRLWTVSHRWQRHCRHWRTCWKTSMDQGTFPAATTIRTRTSSGVSIGVSYTSDLKCPPKIEVQWIEVRRACRPSNRSTASNLSICRDMWNWGGCILQ